MECLETNDKALFIVEGAKSEVSLIKSIALCMKIDFCIFPVCANIHMLYQRMKEEDFNLDIVNLLLELNGVSEEDKKMLRKEKRFAYTYLIFDLDLQHCHLSDFSNVDKGYSTVMKMLEYFNNETDNTIGKMYLNYPMVESYRDCSVFFDLEYKDRIININEIKKYKSIVGKRGNCKDINTYNLSDFINLTSMNLYKGFCITNGKWEKPSYEDYLLYLSQINIAKKEFELIYKKKEIAILNSSLFFIVDYWGNKNGVYDDTY